MQNRNKGITLVALIITIVVMLILVAVSVNVIIKSNLIGTAEKATNKYKTASEEESKGGVIEIDGKKYNSIEDYINLSSINIPGGTRVTEPTEYKVGDKTAIIPAGFTVSGIDSERTIDGGLVIYLIPEEELKDVKWDGTEKTKYDQFVWIPISHEQINNMFICQKKTTSNGSCNIVAENGTAKCTTHNSTQMAGRLYATSTGESYNNPKKEVYTANTGLREPDVVTDVDGNSDNLRYMSTVTGDNTSYASTANKGLENNKVKSSMILGTCHDQMLEFVNVEGKYDVTSAGHALHSKDYDDGPWQTAGLDYTDKTQYKDLSKNIYDLEGNVLEWTTEAYDTTLRVYRGRLLQLQ